MRQPPQGYLVLDQLGQLSISCYGGSWVCDHIDWKRNDGLLLLPIPADSAIVVDSLRDPIDLDAMDRQRLLVQLNEIIAGLDIHGATLRPGTLHECFRAARSVIYVMRTRPLRVVTGLSVVGVGAHR
jgi:hypothetical protein